MLMEVIRIALVVAVLFQPNAPRLFAAFVFVGANVFHYIYLSELDGMLYYGIAALVDLAMVILTSGIRPIPRMVLTLHKIALVSIAANMYGFILWFNYLPPTTYDSAFILIYLWLLLTLIRKGGKRVGGFTISSWTTCFNFNHSSRRVSGDKNQKEI